MTLLYFLIDRVIETYPLVRTLLDDPVFTTLLQSFMYHHKRKNETTLNVQRKEFCIFFRMKRNSFMKLRCIERYTEILLGTIMAF